MTFIELFSTNPLLLLFAVIGLGYLVGSIKVVGFSLGPAAVLFSGILFGALDPRLKVPDVVYILGLILFVYTIGLQSGPTFFSSFGRRGVRANLVAVGVILLGACLSVAAVRLFALDGATAVGVFCGSVTNTPALAESIEAIKNVLGDAGVPNDVLKSVTSAPVIGYSVAYPFGVIGVLLAFYLFGLLHRRGGRLTLASSAEETGESGRVISSRTFRVVNPGIVGKSVERFLEDEKEWGIVLSRLERGGDISLVYPDTVFQNNDLLVAVGDNPALERARELFGEESTREIQHEHRDLDYRRVEVSSKRAIGKTIGELRLQDMLDATITRLRRGDVDFVPTPDTVIERGDRIRVLTWVGNIERVAKFFGDSIRESSEADFFSVSLGVVIGVLLGMLPLPLPGGSAFTLGFAGGPLIAGLVLGRLQRSGGIVWGLPYSANLVLRQVGLVLFLAGIGIKAGDGFVSTLASGGLKLMLVGAVLTITVTGTTLLVGARSLKLSYSAVMGMMSGIQTQPACLAYANEHSTTNAPNVWYASVYPVSMIAKIIVAQLLVRWLL